MEIISSEILARQQHLTATEIRMKQQACRNCLDELEMRLNESVQAFIEHNIITLWERLCRDLGVCLYCTDEGLECPHCGGTAVNRKILRQTA